MKIAGGKGKKKKGGLASSEGNRMKKNGSSVAQKAPGSLSGRSSCTPTTKSTSGSDREGDDADLRSIEAISPEERRLLFAKRLKDLSRELLQEEEALVQQQNTTFIKVSPPNATGSPSTTSPAAKATPASTRSKRITKPSSAVAPVVTPSSKVTRNTSLIVNIADTVALDTSSKTMTPKAAMRPVESMGASTIGTGEPPSMKIPKEESSPKGGVDETFETDDAVYVSPAESFDDTLTTGFSQYSGVDSHLSNHTEASNFVSDLWDSLLMSCTDSVPWSGRQTTPAGHAHTQHADDEYKGPLNPCTARMAGAATHGASGGCAAPTVSSSDSSEDRRSFNSPEATRFAADDERQVSLASSYSTESNGSTAYSGLLDGSAAKDKSFRRSSTAPVTNSIHSGTKRLYKGVVDRFHNVDPGKGLAPMNERFEDVSAYVGDDSTISTKYSI